MTNSRGRSSYRLLEGAAQPLIFALFIALIALFFQLYPAVFLQLLWFVDVRNWSWPFISIVNSIFVVMLLIVYWHRR